MVHFEVRSLTVGVSIQFVPQILAATDLNVGQAQVSSYLTFTDIKIEAK